MSAGLAIVIVGVLALMVYSRGFRLTVGAFVAVIAVLIALVLGYDWLWWLWSANSDDPVIRLAMDHPAWIFPGVLVLALMLWIKEELIDKWLDKRRGVPTGRKAIARIYGRPFPTENKMKGGD
jgi:hypothetical protein